MTEDTKTHSQSEPADAIAEALAQEVYASMRQLSGAKDIPLTVIKAAKEAGAPGFSASNRIYWAELGPWLQENIDSLKTAAGDKDKAQWILLKLKCDALRSELALAKEKGELIAKDEVSTQLTRLTSAASNLLKTKLEDEAPARLAGLDAIAIRQELARIVDDIAATFQKGLGQWTV